VAARSEQQVDRRVRVPPAREEDDRRLRAASELLHPRRHIVGYVAHSQPVVVTASLAGQRLEERLGQRSILPLRLFERHVPTGA
jgi:hypothetical protein